MAHLQRLPDASSKGSDDAKQWAEELIRNKDTNAIVSPVEIEVLAGVRDAHDLELTEAFLSRFRVVDEGNVPQGDWDEAKRIAKRVVKYDREVPRKHRHRERAKHPRTGARQLGDCLITAIALRLGYVVLTDDRGLIRQAGRSR